MSVLAFIINENKEYTNNFTIPVANESFFNKYWVKGINELNLELLSQIEYGLELKRKDLDMFIYELSMLKKWTNNIHEINDVSYMKDRIDLLIKKLPDAFYDQENIVFVG